MFPKIIQINDIHPYTLEDISFSQKCTVKKQDERMSFLDF